MHKITVDMKSMRFCSNIVTLRNF